MAAKLKPVTSAVAIRTIEAYCQTEADRIRKHLSEKAKLRRAVIFMESLLKIQDLFEAHYYEIKKAIGLKARP